MHVRWTLVALFLACPAWASLAQARGLEYGPRIARSIPTQDSREALTPAMYYGATATFMQTPRAGAGFDLGYQRWPGSPNVDQELDAFFSLITGAPISGSKTTVSVFQATAHGKFFALEQGPILPWLKIGVGLDRVNRKLELPVGALQAAGARFLKYDPNHVEQEMAVELGGGIDLPITSQTKLSLDASYHFAFLKDEPFQLTALTLGVSLLDVSR
jgi:hypothetical protein